MNLGRRQANNHKYRKELILRATGAEKALANILDNMGVRYLFQKGFLLPFHRICDFYIPRFKIGIEVDGPYHKDTTLKDEYKDEGYWRARGIRTLRFLNEEVIDTPKIVAERIRVALISD